MFTKFSVTFTQSAKIPFLELGAVLGFQLLLKWLNLPFIAYERGQVTREAAQIQAGPAGLRVEAKSSRSSALSLGKVHGSNFKLPCFLPVPSFGFMCKLYLTLQVALCHFPGVFLRKLPEVTVLS